MELAKDQFGDRIKAAVDVQREVLAIGGELHADEEALLLKMVLGRRICGASTSIRRKLKLTVSNSTP